MYKIYLKRCALLFVVFALSCGGETRDISVKKYLIKTVKLKGLGSGLVYLEKRDGKDVFLTIGDRENLPLLAEIVVDQEKAVIENQRLVKGKGKLDFEGIAYWNNKLFIANEFGPSIYQLNATTAKEEKVYLAGRELPSILREQQTNKGFEGITSDGTGNIYAVMQAPLGQGFGQPRLSSFIRIVKYNLQTKKSNMYAYSLEHKPNQTKSVKLSALTFIDNTRLLVVERSSYDDKKDETKIFKIDLKNAGDLVELFKDGSLPEYEEKHERLFGKNGLVKPVSKELLINLNDFDWPLEKLEGLALLPDYQTVVVVNDNENGQLHLWYFKLSKPLKNSRWLVWSLFGIILLLFISYRLTRSK